MLPIKRRIKKDSFGKIMKEGIFVHADNYYMKLLDRKDTLPSLLAFVVSAKVKKTSVARHLIKRKMTAAVEKVLINIKPGYSAIIFAKKDTSTLPYVGVEKEITSLTQKAKMLNV